MESSDTLHPQPPQKSAEPATAKLREQARTVGEDVRAMGGLAREAAHEQYDAAKETANQYVEQGKRRMDDYEDQLVSYVRTKPVKSVLVAAGIGAVLGLFWSRR